MVPWRQDQDGPWRVRQIRAAVHGCRSGDASDKPGGAGKEQVQEMVRRLLTLDGNPGPDAADALACAICHAHGGQGLGRLATAGYRVRRGRLV